MISQVPLVIEATIQENLQALLLERFPQMVKLNAMTGRALPPWRPGAHDFHRCYSGCTTW